MLHSHTLPGGGDKRESIAKVECIGGNGCWDGLVLSFRTKGQGFQRDARSRRIF